MKKRILSILLLCCMVLTMMPATVFAADGEVAARASETGGLYEYHEAYGADPAAAHRQVRARLVRHYLYGSPYQKKFQPVTDIHSRVGRIARMGSRNIFAKRDIIGIT